MPHAKELAAPKTEASASYQSILIHCDATPTPTTRIKVAAQLARDHGAKLIGVGAETVDPIAFAEPFSMGVMGATTELAVLLQEQVTRNLKASEAGFRRDSAGAEAEWRSAQDYPDRALSKLAHLADLIVVGPRKSPISAHADPAEVVMASGRPVLVVPEGSSHLHARSVLAAWKNTRESRRALSDAMPFLRRAKDVFLHAVVEEGQEEEARAEVAEVAALLKRHGVSVTPSVSVADDDKVAEELGRVADRCQADLIVAGAYGHARLREWVFGGVTETLLHKPRHFVLLSH